jgi:hypothetical protein
MLIQQQKIQFSAFSGLYDLIIPKDNLLRKINELIDFSFIYDQTNIVLPTGVRRKVLYGCSNTCC